MICPLPPQFEGKARVTGRIVQLPAHDAHEIERHLAVIREAGLRVEDVEIRKPASTEVAAQPARSTAAP